MVLFGELVILRFMIDNILVFDVMSIVFMDNLNSVISGMVMEVFLFVNFCGGIFIFFGNNFFIFLGVLVVVGIFCIFDVFVCVLVGVVDGEYINVISNLIVIIDGVIRVLDFVLVLFIVDVIVLEFIKSFMDDLVMFGDLVMFEFIFINFNVINVISNIVFFDDLGVVLLGL